MNPWTRELQAPAHAERPVRPAGAGLTSYPGQGHLLAFLLVRASRQIARKLIERLLVDSALEFDDILRRRPVVMPAPGIEFGFFGCTQTDVAIASGQPQQEPDLFLAAVIAAPLAPQPAFAYPFTPEHLVFAIAQNDSDVGAIAIPVDHGHPRIC